MNAVGDRPRRRLLLVDDEERLLRACARAWRARHPTIEVVCVASSTEALRHIESAEAFDGALIDAYLGDPDKRERRIYGGLRLADDMLLRPAPAHVAIWTGLTVAQIAALGERRSVPILPKHDDTAIAAFLELVERGSPERAGLRPEDDARRAEERFDLSRAETHYLLAKLRGWNDADYADERGLSASTLAAHRASVMKKLGVTYVEQLLHVLWAADRYR